MPSEEVKKMVYVFEDKLDKAKMTVNDGAIVKAGVFTEIARFQVPISELRRYWGWTQEVSATQVLMGKITVVLKDSTPAEIDDNATVRLGVRNASGTEFREVYRFKYADIKAGADLPIKLPGAKTWSYLVVEVALPEDATSTFTFSAANSEIDISTTVVQA